ncbi:MAG: hypothetical protein GXP62_20070 [Oligoflexia bacterium]|nr:hypothetical protein [Oligoflexia bacterium]
MLLTGCGTAPEGAWTGTLDCGDEDSSGTITIGLDLARDDDMTLTGSGTMSFDGSFQMNGTWQGYREDISYDAITLVLTQPSGAQDVTLTGTATTCETWVGGKQSSTTCTGGNDLDMPLSWDGEDRMTVDQGDCSGALDRQ